MTILEIIKKLNIRKGYSPIYGECKISIKIDGTAIKPSPHKGKKKLSRKQRKNKL